MNEPREALTLPWVLLFLVLLTLALLIWLWQDAGRRISATHQSRPSEVAAAYLQAETQTLTDGAPNLPALLERLAQINLALGHLARAEEAIRRLERQPVKDSREGALLLRLEAQRTAMFSSPPGSAHRLVLAGRLDELWRQVPQGHWTGPQLLILWDLARSVDAWQTLQWLNLQLEPLDPGHRMTRWREVARSALSQGQFEVAAQADFTLQRLAADPGQQRQAFQAGLEALVAGNQAARACLAAQSHLPALTPDSATLTLVLRVALMGECHQLALDMARRLMVFSQATGTLSPVREEVRRASHWPVHRLSWNFEPSGLQRVATVQLPTPLPEGTYELMYEAFVQNHQLPEAIQLTHKALKHHLDDERWEHRLAQLYEWNGQPRLALEHWLIEARHNQNPEAWERVTQLSRQLNEVPIYLEALQQSLRLHPKAGLLINQIVATQERLGQPEQALATLKENAQGSLRVPLLEHYAQLSVIVGADDQARATYETLQREYGPSVYYALALADIDQRQGHLEQALADLEGMRPEMEHDPRDAPFWRHYAELAILNRREEQADQAYRNLLDSGLFALPTAANPSSLTSEQRATLLDDLGHLQAFYANYPYDAARLQELEFRFTGHWEALQSALETYMTMGAWDRVDILMGQLTLAQRQTFSHHSNWWVLRARYGRHLGKARAVSANLRQALALGPQSEGERINLLWALIDLDRPRELREALRRWEGSMQNAPVYFSVASAGYLKLGKARWAMGYLYRQSPARRSDPAWLLLMAEAREQLGHDTQAWRLRRQAWRQFVQALQNSAGAPKMTRLRVGHAQPLFGLGPREALENPDAPDLQRAALGSLFQNGDQALGSYRRLLRQVLSYQSSGAIPGSHLGPIGALQDNLGIAVQTCPSLLSLAKSADWAHQINCVDPTAVLELFIAWAVTLDAQDLALRLERASRVTHDPANVHLSIAMLTQDRDTLTALIDDPEQRQAAPRQLEVLQRLGRTSQLQTAAFEAVAEAPDAPDLQSTLRGLLLAPVSFLGERTGPMTNAYWSPMDSNSPNLVFQSSMTRWSALQYQEHALGWEDWLNAEWGIALESVDRQTQLTGGSDLVRLPSRDLSNMLTLRDHLPDYEWLFSVGERRTDYLNNTYLASVQSQSDPALRTRLSVGWHQFSGLTPALQVAGMKDLIEMDGEWDLSARTYVQGTVEVDRFSGQNGLSLGHGDLGTLEMGYHLWVEPTDLTARVMAFQGQNQSTGQPLGELGRYLPSNQRGQNPFALPGTIAQTGFLLSWNGVVRNAQSPRGDWQPYADAGVIHDRQGGGMPQLNVGLAGSVAGADQAKIYYFHVTTPGSAQSFSQFGLNYRYFY